MIERQGQEIDALLVSALYGELTPADEAKLASHLESHPADRGALDDLKVARQAIRESRIFELQLDPPQSVSALLLQEAARRAPKRVIADDSKREGWFHKLTRSFMAHPAMATAAMLVLVVGVAGTIYMKKGNDQFAEQVATQDTTMKGEGAPARTADTSTTALAGPSAGSAAMTDDGVTVALREEDTRAGQGQEQLDGHGKTGGDYRKADASAIERQRKQTAQVAKPNVDHAAPPKPTSPTSKGAYLEMHSPDPTPKDMEPRGGTVAKADPQPTTESGFGTTTNGVIGGGGPTGNSAAAPPPVAQMPPSVTVDRPTTKPADNKPAMIASDKKEASKDDPVTSWARDRHQYLLGLVKSGKCQEAAPVAVQIKTKAPDYYNAYVANDRGLKPCMAYITDAAERDAEKSQKSRPAKRVDASESTK